MLQNSRNKMLPLTLFVQPLVAAKLHAVTNQHFITPCTRPDTPKSYTLIDYPLNCLRPMYTKCLQINTYKLLCVESFILFPRNKQILLYCVRNVMAHGDARQGKWRGNWRMQWVASTLTRPRNVVYPILLTLMRTPRLPAVDWTDAPTDLNGLVRLGERRNVVSARVPSGSARALHPNSLFGFQHIHIICTFLALRTAFLCVFMVKGPVKRVRRPYGLAQLHLGCWGFRFTDVCLKGDFRRNDCDRQVRRE